MFLHLGYGSYVDQNEIKRISGEFRTGYLNKIIEASKMREDFKDYDFTSGKLKKTLILFKDNSFAFSAIEEKELKKRYEINKNSQYKPYSMLFVGNDNYINIDQIYMFTGNIKAKPLVRKIKMAKENNIFIDFTSNEPMRTILFMKDKTIIITHVDEITLNKNINKFICK